MAATQSRSLFAPRDMTEGAPWKRIEIGRASCRERV